MKAEYDIVDTILKVWQTNNRITVFLIEYLPAELWSKGVPGHSAGTDCNFGA